jgi:hypothetical protein
MRTGVDSLFQEAEDTANNWQTVPEVDSTTTAGRAWLLKP